MNANCRRAGCRCSRNLVRPSCACVAILIIAAHVAAAADAPDAFEPDYGLLAGAGYFDFRNSLFADRDPDAPGELGENWLESYAKLWFEGRFDAGRFTLLGRGSVAYAITSVKAPELSGGHADSFDVDDAWLGLRIGEPDDGEWQLSAGRYPFELAHGFLIADGYADGGSRGALWSNPRKAFRFGAHLGYQRAQHAVDVFYLERDERPESDSDASIAGINYEWSSPGDAVTLGAALLDIDADGIRAQLDGAEVYNVRAEWRPVEQLSISAEYVKEANGNVLDAAAWYLHGTYEWPEARWPATLEYRYAYFEGDDPETTANENYDPLFPGFQDWGTWFQGEIAGGWFLSNSNLKTHMLRLTFEPHNDWRVGLSAFDFRLDEPGAYGPDVSSSAVARELDIILDWTANDYVGCTFVLAWNDPGAAVAEIYQRSSSFRYAMIYVTVNVE